MALLCLTGFMVVLDAQIVLVALPSIEEDLAASGAGGWVLSGYLLAFGGLLLFGGRLGDLWGRRRVLVLGTAAFGVSSLLCGLAWSAEVLVAARVLQGVSAAEGTRRAGDPGRPLPRGSRATGRWPAGLRSAASASARPQPC